MRIFTQDAVPQRLTGSRRMISNVEAARIMRRSADILTRDAVISAETTSRNPDMLGHLVWSGDLKPVGDAVARVIDALRRVKDGAQRAQALSKAVCDIAGYGNEVGQGLSPGAMRAGNAESLGTGADRPERDFSLDESPDESLGSGATPQAVNDANRKFWADHQWNPNATHVTRSGATSIADINRANSDFWAKETRHQTPVKREWGRG
jgi:hypothetical protein